ncbi:unnamed protein product [Rodentolepis nana]|uniref:ARID domain-containing protein n=1 Tax=Rodentolepis nana TaxID=102285 RepID=A0A0R3TVG0_RODNA|nr:unnamed protein product [Rodentolepis nana]
MYVVEIGLEETSSEEKENEFCHQQLLLFLYTIYSNFLPAKNMIETFIGPRDEKNILQLALSQSKFEADPSSDILNLIWIEASKQRLFGIQENDNCLVEAIEQILKSNNIIDRVYLVKRIKDEYFENAELINALHSAEYIVVSNQLTWFEHLVVSLLIEIKVPNIRFTKTPDFKPFLSLQQCSTVHELFVEPEPISRSLLAYLAVAVNVKNTFDLALIINKPFRGFNRSFFSTLRRISSNASMLPGQLVLSYPACMTASAATSTLRIDDAKLLKTSTSGLEHLANTIRTCQDALSGFLDDDASLASSSQFGSMSTEAAADAVRACFTVTLRAFTRPPRLNKDPEKTWSMNDIKAAKKSLNERLEQLLSSPLVKGCENLISSTPNRPVYAGGSLQGRPAYRLARLFLVYEATRQVAPPRRPDTSTMTPQCTPIGHRTFNAFFESPAPQDRTPQVTKATPTNASKTPSKAEKTPEQAVSSSTFMLYSPCS